MTNGINPICLDGKSEAIVPDYNKFATENKGIFRIGAVDCLEYEVICKKEGITEYPTIKLYPQFPMPASEIEIGEKFDIAKLKKSAGKFYTDRSIEITQNNH